MNKKVTGIFQPVTNNINLLFISVMRAALNNINTALLDFIHNSVAVINPPAPITAKIAHKRLRLADPLIPAALNVAN